MSLTRESTIKKFGNQPGDIKIVNYTISFTANQLVEPTTDLGWFLLNGSVVSQTTYPILFARFGTLFNTGGEGVGNFRLPDMTDGKVPIPKGLTNFTTYAALGGEINHTMAAGETPVHAHGDTFSATASAHSHSGTASINATNDSHAHSSLGCSIGTPGYGTGGGIADSFNQATLNVGTSTYGGHTHPVSASINNTTGPNLSVSGGVSAAGGGGSHNNMQPYQVFSGWLVKHD